MQYAHKKHKLQFFLRLFTYGKRIELNNLLSDVEDRNGYCRYVMPVFGFAMLRKR